MTRYQARRGSRLSLSSLMLLAVFVSAAALMVVLVAVWPGFGSSDARVPGTDAAQAAPPASAAAVAPAATVPPAPGP